MSTKTNEQLTIEKLNHFAVASIIIVLQIISLGGLAFLGMTYDRMTARLDRVDSAVDTASTRISNLHKITKSNYTSSLEHLETAKSDLSALEGRFAVLDSSIETGKKRWARISQTRDAIVDSLPNHHPLPGCKDKPSPAYLLKTAGYIVDYSDQYGVPVALTMAVNRQESIFCQEAKSPAGAIGTMQLMKATAEELSAEMGIRLERHRLGDNIRLGCYYISKMLITFNGNTSLAIKAYNAGPNHILKAEAGLVGPRDCDGVSTNYYCETFDYAKTVLGFYEEYQAVGLK